MGDLCPRSPSFCNHLTPLGSPPPLKSITEMFRDAHRHPSPGHSPVAEGRRFHWSAQTGTAKQRLGLPLLDHLDTEGTIQALVLAPTRELGQQIAEQLEKFAKHKKGLKTVAVYGGANIATQIAQLKKPCHVVIATPGRLIDLAKRKAVKLDASGTSCWTRRRDVEHGVQGGAG